MKKNMRTTREIFFIGLERYQQQMFHDRVGNFQFYVLSKVEFRKSVVITFRAMYTIKHNYPLKDQKLFLKKFASCFDRSFPFNYHGRSRPLLGAFLYEWDKLEQV